MSVVGTALDVSRHEQPREQAEMLEALLARGGWALLEFLGRQPVIGQVEWVQAGGTWLLHVVSPSMAEYPEFRQMYALNALLGITPLPEGAARAWLSSYPMLYHAASQIPFSILDMMRPAVPEGKPAAEDVPF